MRSACKALVIFLLIGLALWAASFGIEALRSVPKEPKTLAWAENAEINHVDLGGVNVRYLKAGIGPDLVLLHTLRTQLDIYHKMIPELQKHFTVYALDYPGHGWSDIPGARYHPDDFYTWVEKFLDKIGVEKAAVAGISIGGTIVLELAARQNPRIANVISINPYDYPTSYSAGLKGSSFFANIMFTATDIPFIGETFMRLRNPFVERKLFEGGVVESTALSQELYEEMSGVGNRSGHYQGFISLLREEHHWPKARDNYKKIKVPVLLIYADKDWAPHSERQKTRKRLPNAQSATIKNGGHFLSLDRPQGLAELIVKFALSQNP